jgi:hypothetical protein
MLRKGWKFPRKHWWNGGNFEETNFPRLGFIWIDGDRISLLKTKAE